MTFPWAQNAVASIDSVLPRILDSSCLFATVFRTVTSASVFVNINVLFMFQGLSESLIVFFSLGCYFSIDLVSYIVSCKKERKNGVKDTLE